MLNAVVDPFKLNILVPYISALNTHVYTIPDAGKGSVTCRRLLMVVALTKIVLTSSLFFLIPFLYHSTLTCGDITAGKCRTEVTMKGT